MFENFAEAKKERKKKKESQKEKKQTDDIFSWKKLPRSRCYKLNKSASFHSYTEFVHYKTQAMALKTS